MKFVKPVFLDSLCEEKLKIHQEKYDFTQVYAPNKVRNFQLFFNILLAVILFIISNTIIVFDDLVYNFSLPDFAILAMSILIIYYVMIIVHEFIHYIAYPRDKENIYVTFESPSIYIFYDGLLTKKRALTMLIAPTIVIFLVTITVFRSRMDLIVLLTFLNLIQSSSDIFNFFYILTKTNSKAYGYGNWYTSGIKN